MTPATDADPARDDGRNTGVSGTRHAVVEPPSAAAFADGARPADDGNDGDGSAAELEEAQAQAYDDEPADSGIAILGDIRTTEVPGDAPTAPTAPEPTLNVPIAKDPRPVGDKPIPPGPSGPGFGTGYGGNKMTASADAEAKNVRDLSLDQRMRIWRWRLLIMVIAGLVSGLPTRSWIIGLTLAVLAGIVDTIYRARKIASISTGASPDRAQRQTQRQLAGMRRRGYLTLHARPIPDSREVIDHLVVGPTGVYAIDSEKWRKDFPIRTRAGKQLWHGPDSKKARLEHARWEAQQASERLSSALGRQIVVRPAMAVYGPKIPWDVATIRDVDVFSGPRLRKYFSRRARKKEIKRLTADEVHKIFEAAGTVLPEVAPARRSVAATRNETPVG